jgi:hypothetical protein
MTTTQDDRSLTDELMDLDDQQKRQEYIYGDRSEEDLKLMGIGILSIASEKGDTRIMWDPRDADEVKVAKEAFEKAKKKGMLAYAVGDDGERTGDVIREFDPSRSKIIMTKQLAGG